MQHQVDYKILEGLGKLLYAKFPETPLVQLKQRPQTYNASVKVREWSSPRLSS